MKQIVCNYCGRKGHIAAECYKAKNHNKFYNERKYERDRSPSYSRSRDSTPHPKDRSSPREDRGDYGGQNYKKQYQDRGFDKNRYKSGRNQSEQIIETDNVQIINYYNLKVDSVQDPRTRLKVNGT